jgi:hypothetical protein
MKLKFGDKESIEKRDELADEVDKRYHNGEITFQERHKLLDEINRKIMRVLEDLDASK